MECDRLWGWKPGWAGGEKEKTLQAGPSIRGDWTCSAPRAVPPQVKQNLLNVSYHIAQYTSIISDLRGEIQRLKCKIDEQGGRGPAQGRLERGDIRHIQGVCDGGGGGGLRLWEPISGSPPSLSQIAQGSGSGSGFSGQVALG